MITQKFPSFYKPFIGNAIYDAAYGVVVPNRYHFAKEQKTLGINIRNGCLYYIDVLNVSSNIKKSDYILSVDVEPKLSFLFSTGLQTVYPRPISVRTLFDNAPLSHFFYHDQSATTLDVSFSGQFSQSSDMIGMGIFYIAFQVFVYEIADKGYINEFRNEKHASYYRGMS